MRVVENKMNSLFSFLIFKLNSDVKIYHADLYGMTAGSLPLVEYYYVTKVGTDWNREYYGYLLLDEVSEKN